jgi:hypothetical protein
MTSSFNSLKQLIDDGVDVVCQMHMPRQWHLRVMPGCNDAPAATGNDRLHAEELRMKELGFW